MCVQLAAVKQMDGGGRADRRSRRSGNYRHQHGLPGRHVTGASPARRDERDLTTPKTDRGDDIAVKVRWTLKMRAVGRSLAQRAGIGASTSRGTKVTDDSVQWPTPAAGSTRRCRLAAVAPSRMHSHSHRRQRRYHLVREGGSRGFKMSGADAVRVGRGAQASH